MSSLQIPNGMAAESAIFAIENGEPDAVWHNGNKKRSSNREYFLLSIWRAVINRLLHSMLNAPAPCKEMQKEGTKNVVKETSAGVRCVFTGKMNCELYANESCESINMVFIVHHHGEWCMASWMTKRIKAALDPRCHFFLVILSLKLQSWQSQSECIWLNQ